VIAITMAPMSVHSTSNRTPYSNRPPVDSPGRPLHDDMPRESSPPATTKTDSRPIRPTRLLPYKLSPYIEQAIQEAQDRQQAWENGIDPDRDNDRGVRIE
jgi:hypothetical protein